MNLDKLMSAVKANEFLTGPWPLKDGKQLEWNSTDDTPLAKPFLDPEVVRTLGGHLCKEAVYCILQSVVYSENEQPVEFHYVKGAVRQIFLNGREMGKNPANLIKGENRLVLLFHTASGPRGEVPKFNPEYSGCLLRLSKPGASERLSGLRFEPAITK